MACKSQLHSTRDGTPCATGYRETTDISVYASLVNKGFVHWRFESWERNLPGSGYEGGDLSYGAQDVIAQGGLTDAVFDWLDDESKEHPTHLKQSLAGIQPIVGNLL